MIAEYDGSNNLLASYTFGPGIDQPMSMYRGGEMYWYHSDALGSITELTDDAEAVVRSYEYSAFGKIISETGTLENPFTYTAREYDEESGLYYYRARYYDAGIGRFLSRDPIGISGGINLYVYGANNPLMLTDPLGLKAWFDTMMLVASVVGLGVGVTLLLVGSSSIIVGGGAVLVAAGLFGLFYGLDVWPYARRIASRAWYNLRGEGKMGQQPSNPDTPKAGDWVPPACKQ